MQYDIFEMGIDIVSLFFKFLVLEGKVDNNIMIA